MRQAHSESRHVKLAIDGSAALDFTHTHTKPSKRSFLSPYTHCSLTHTHTPNPASILPFPPLLPYTQRSTRSPLSPCNLFGNPASFISFSHTGNPARVSPASVLPLQATQPAFSPCPLQATQQANVVGNDLRDPAGQARRFLNIACRGEGGIRSA